MSCNKGFSDASTDVDLLFCSHFLQSLFHKVKLVGTYKAYFMDNHIKMGFQVSIELIEE